MVKRAQELIEAARADFRVGKIDESQLVTKVIEAGTKYSRAHHLLIKVDRLLEAAPASGSTVKVQKYRSRIKLRKP